MENKLESNPYKKGTKASRFLNIADVDYETGYSRVVPINEFPTDMELGNGGGWCRNDGPLGTFFNIDRKKSKGKIVSVQLVGYKKILLTAIFPQSSIIILKILDVVFSI